jgi:hypothetical protein
VLAKAQRRASKPQINRPIRAKTPSERSFKGRKLYPSPNVEEVFGYRTEITLKNAQNNEPGPLLAQKDIIELVPEIAKCRFLLVICVAEIVKLLSCVLIATQCFKTVTFHCQRYKKRCAAN